MGVKLNKWYTAKEDALPFDVIVTNHDGKLVGGQTVVATVERKWGEYKDDEQVRTIGSDTKPIASRRIFDLSPDSSLRLLVLSGHQPLEGEH